MHRLKVLLQEKLMGRFWRMWRSGLNEVVTDNSGGIVLIGDSITHSGRWDLLFADLPIRNFGISGECSGHLLQRLEPVIRVRPSKIFVLIGTNDLTLEYAPAQIAANVEQMLARFRAELPECRLYLQSVMPRQAKYAARVQGLNALYAALAQRLGAQYIDLYTALAEPSGELRPELTSDRLHLLGKGYRVWRDLIAPYVRA